MSLSPLFLWVSEWVSERVSEWVVSYWHMSTTRPFSAIHIITCIYKKILYLCQRLRPHGHSRCQHHVVACACSRSLHVRCILVSIPGIDRTSIITGSAISVTTTNLLNDRTKQNYATSCRKTNTQVSDAAESVLTQLIHATANCNGHFQMNMD